MPCDNRLSLIVKFDCHCDNLGTASTSANSGHAIVSLIITGGFDCQDGRQSIDDDLDNRLDDQERQTFSIGNKGGRTRPTCRAETFAHEASCLVLTLQSRIRGSVASN